MTYIFSTTNGNKLIGETPEDIVKELCTGDLFTQDMSVEDCMKLYAEQARSLYGLNLPTDTAKKFVRELVRAKLLIWENKPENKNKRRYFKND